MPSLTLSFAPLTDGLDRDPEADNEEKGEEEKVAEEEPAAIESGFPAASTDWEAAPAGFAGATAGGGWDATNEEWGNAPAATTTAAAAAAPAAGGEWSNEAAKETQW